MRAAWIVLLAGCGFESPLAMSPMNDAPDTPPDAPVDNASFDYKLCPASYNAQLPGPSRYRLITNGHSAWDHSATCNADLPQATHLVVLETMQEFTNVKAFVDGLPNNAIVHNAVWIGGVQPKTVAKPDEGWLAFDGTPLIKAWDTTTREPNDGSGETDHSEQFVFYEHNRPGLADVPGNTNSAVLCECDGKPVDASVASLINSNH